MIPATPPPPPPPPPALLARPSSAVSSLVAAEAPQLQSARSSTLAAAGLQMEETDISKRNAYRAGQRPLSARQTESVRAEPELLSRLLAYVRHEFRHLRGQPSPEERLQVLSSVFDTFIANFRSYTPLLTAIKHAYDEALNHERARARSVGELSGRLSLMQAETQQVGVAWDSNGPQK